MTESYLACNMFSAVFKLKDALLNNNARSAFANVSDASEVLTNQVPKREGGQQRHQEGQPFTSTWLGSEPAAFCSAA